MILAGVTKSIADARQQLETSISSGRALEKMRELVAAQGGDVGVIDEPSRLPRAQLRTPLTAARGGYVTEVDAMGVAMAALRLGAGRASTTAAIDHAVGISELVKIGEKIEAGAPLCVIHANDPKASAEAESTLRAAIKIGDAPVAPPKLVDEIL